MNVCHLCHADHPTMISLPTCETCFGEVAAALESLPGLLAGLETITPQTLARPARETPGGPGGFGPSSPAREALIDLRAELSATVTEWAAAVEPWAAGPPTRTLVRHLSAALGMGGGADWAAKLLHLTDVARRRLDPPEVIHLRDRCPECGTRGLVRYDTGGPCWCVNCYAETYPAA
ncbi:hypothetical protein [Actinomadura litoris]|uniref:hypothetical protein n=1 Tax=Actinomadura litoris TaxID=2678616 RepID=UPI001FA7D53B|nr:hypothetical protein [Actinomadura litoris]